MAGKVFFSVTMAPFRPPVFLVTHTEREPRERSGGTTLHLVNGGINGRARSGLRGRRRPRRPHRGRRRGSLST